MKKLAILALLFLAWSLQATVIVYKQTYTETVTGRGTVTTTNYTGYVIVDDQGNLTQILTLDKAKTFRVFNVSDEETVNFYYLNSGGGKQTFVVSVTESRADASCTVAKGSSSTFNVGNGPFTIAKTMTINGSDTGTANDGEEILGEFKGSLSYDQKTTEGANKAGNDLDAVVASIRATYFGKHYTEQ